MNFIEVIICKSTRREAERLAEEVPLLRNSITSGDGTIAGKIGELIVKRYTESLYIDDYEFDVKLGDSRIEVKTCRTNVKPKPHYLCKVALANTHQECDYYTFVRVLYDYSKGWILGSIRKDRFMRIARRFERGEIDPTSPDKRHPWICDGACLAVPATELKLRCDQEESILL